MQGEKSSGAARAVLRIVIMSIAFVGAIVLTAHIAGLDGSISSILIGGAISILSFAILAASVSASVSGAKRGGFSGRAAFVCVIAMLKFVLIGGVLWWLITRGLVTPLPFAAGFSAMVAALLIEGLRIGAIGPRHRI